MFAPPNSTGQAETNLVKNSRRPDMGRISKRLLLLCYHKTLAGFGRPVQVHRFLAMAYQSASEPMG
jgi:hypothetical protein